MPSIFSSFLQLREFDDSGKLLASGTMSFFLAGTSTLANVYADAAGTPLANPVQLNGAGTAIVYGDQKAYRIEIHDVDNALIFEVDNVYPFGQSAAGTGSGTFGVALTYNGVRNLTSDTDVLAVCGRNAPGDGGQGMFFRTSDTPADNDCTVLAHGATRYIRQYTGYVDPRWAGVQYGVSNDQHAALNTALAAGITQANGYVYIDQDYHMAGILIFLSGGFYSSATPKLYIDGKILAGVAGMFGVNIEVHFNMGVTDAIRSSWFAGGANQSLCTTYSYDYYFDADTSPSMDLVMPYNYRVDFCAGAQLIVNSLINISIANLVYSGSSQIIKYHDITTVGSVDFGNTYAQLEWFGGVSGYAFGIDNSVSGKAAINSGRISLSASYYRINNVDTGWTIYKPLYITSVVQGNSLDISQNITCSELHLTNTTVTGAAIITANGSIYVDHSSVLSIQNRSGANSQAASVAAYLPGVYTVAGTNGMLRRSSDLNTWSASSGITDNLGSLAKASVWVATGDSGRVWTSNDGGTTWASASVAAATLSAAAYLQNQYIVIGQNGALYSSTDAVAWNYHPVGTTATLKSITWHASSGLYVVVGTGAYIATSPDLVTWTKRNAPTGVINDLNTVVAGSMGLVASGALAGVYIRSTDAATWYSYSLADSTTIYASADSTDTIVLTGANGYVYKSTNSGITFSSQLVAASVPLLCASWAQGDWVFGAPNGVVYHTTNLVNFNSGYVGVAYDVRAAYVSAPVYAIAGASNSLQISSNSVSWSNVTVDGSTANWNNIRILNGLAWLCGSSGRLFVTSDFVSFKSVSGISSANDVWDIVYNTTASKYTVVGSNGFVASAPGLFASSPAWTIATSVTASTLTRATWSNAQGYVFSGSSVVVTSSDAVTLTLVSYTINGLVYTGSKYVLYGNSGVVLTASTLTGPWTKAVSNTTYNLLDGIYQSGTIVLVGANGTCIKSTDGISWSNISVGTTNQINAIAWNAGTSKLGIACSGYAAYQSGDLGSTWSSVYSGANTQDYLGIWAIGSNWNICGTGGLWMSSPDNVTWTNRTTGVTANLYAGSGNLCIGDSGSLLSIASGSMTNYASTYNVSSVGFRKINQGTLLDSSGKLWNTDAAFGFLSGTTTTVPGLRSLAYAAGINTLYAVGDSAWASLDNTSHEIWTKSLAQFSGVNDMQSVSGVLYAVGSNGLYASSTNGLVWNYLGATTWVDTNTYYNVLAYQANLPQFGIPGVQAFVQGKYLVAVTGTVIYSGATLFYPTLNGSQINSNYGTSNTVWTSSSAGVISYSNLRSLSYVGAVNDSSFDQFNGSIYGNIVRTTVVAATSINIPVNLYIADSTLSKTVVLDHNNLPLIKFGGSRLSLSNVGIENNGSLVYSTQTASVILTGCYNSTNFGFALSNGLAKVSLNNCGASANSTAYAIDGYTLDDSYTWTTDTVLTGSLTGWSGSTSGVTTDGSTFTFSAATHLSSDYASGNTLRFYLLDSLVNLGGRLKIEVMYPGTAPNDVALTATIAHSRVQGYEVFHNQWWTLCEAYEVGVNTPWHSSTAGESVTSWTNVWAGFNNITQPGGGFYTQIQDMWGTAMALISTPINPGFVVIKNSGTGVVPAGTTIRVTVVHSLPYSIDAFSRFYNQASTAADSYQNLPRYFHSFSGVQRGSNEIQTQVVAAGGLTTMQKFMSQGPAGSGYLNAWTPGQTYFLPSTYPSAKSGLLPFISTTYGVQRLRIGLQALKIVDTTDTNWGNRAADLNFIGGTAIPEALEVSNNSWQLSSYMAPSAFVV